jgi:undecaprenyl-diphosphatase
MWTALRIVAGFAVHLALVVLVGAYFKLYSELTGTFLDTPLLWLAHQLGGASADGFAAAATHLGGGAVLATCWLGLLAMAWSRGDGGTARWLVVSAVGSALLTAAGKALVHAARPELWPREHLGGGSFPSSHASGSAALMTVVVVLAWPTRWRGPAIAIAGTWVLLVAFTRVKLGVHRPTEVLVSALFAVSWVLWALRSRHAS